MFIHRVYQLLVLALLAIFSVTANAQIEPPCPAGSPSGVFGFSNCNTLCVNCELPSQFSGTVGYNTNGTGVNVVCGQVLVGSPNIYPFVAGTPNSSFKIEVTSSETGNGIQVMVLDECGSDQAIYCDPGGMGTAFIPKLVNLTNLTVGKTYYLMLDPWVDDVCDFQFTSLTPGAFTAPAPGVPGQPQGPATVCPGNSFQYCIDPVPGATYYTWTAPPGARINGQSNILLLEGSQGLCVDIQFANTGGNVVVRAGSSCHAPTTSAPKNVQIQPGSVVQLGDVNVPFSALPYSWPLDPSSVAVLPGTFTFTKIYTASTGCDSIIKQTIIVAPPPVGTALGKVYTDANNNGLQDAGEGPYPVSVILKSSSGQIASTDANGRFVLSGLQDGDTIRVAPTPGVGAVHPGFLIYHLGLWDGYNFGLNPDLGMADLSVHVSGKGKFKPGFLSAIFLTVTNENTGAVENAEVKLVLPPNIDIYNSYPYFDVQVGDTLVWHIGHMNAYEQQNIKVTIKVGISYYQGVVLYFTGSGTTTSQEITLTNNSHTYSHIVASAFDPNDKQVEPKAITPAFIASGKPLEYTIRFQNTGTAPAEFVRIVDTLQMTIDPASFRLVASSHPCTWKLHGKGVVEFIFDPIDLPDSTENELESHGFVQFTLRPAAGIQPGWDIQNTCDIYFDYNAPVRTNTASAQVVYQIPGNSLLLSHSLRLKPNPAVFQTQAYWSIPAPADGYVRVYNMYGKLEMEVAVSEGEKQKNLPLTGIAPGFYIVTLQAGALFETKELVVVPFTAVD